MSARRRKPTSRRTTGCDAAPDGPARTPGEPAAPFYDPAEALEVFDRPAAEGSSPHATEALFDVSALDETPQPEPVDSDEAPRAEPADLDEKMGEPRTRDVRRKRRGLIGGLFSRRPTSTDATDVADAGNAAETLQPVQATATGQIALDAEVLAPEGDAGGEIAEVVEIAPALVPAAEPEDVPEPRDTQEADPAADVPGEQSVSQADALEADETGGRWVRPVRRRLAGRAHRRGATPAEIAPAEHASDDGPRGLSRARALALRGAKTTLGVVLVIVVLMGALYGLVIGVNSFARWNARRLAEAATSTTTAANNLLVIGVRDGVAVGFTALKAERANGRVLGIAIPEGAFVEVPGQGFERIGSSYSSGSDVSKDTVSNYLGVPFRRYIVVDNTTYQALLRNENVAGLMRNVTATDLTTAERTSYTSYFASVKTKNVWIASLPVKAVTVGDQQYYEPQRSQVADLLLQWWGVKVSDQDSTARVIVYNGVGTPGLAGLASQQLIKGGFRIVNSGNAPNFNYKYTQILLYHGTQADAAAVRTTLGVGQIKVQSAPQELTDMIVIIGADYRPPVADAATSTVSTGGAQ